jgi:hypothetical protein
MIFQILPALQADQRQLILPYACENLMQNP